LVPCETTQEPKTSKPRGFFYYNFFAQERLQTLKVSWRCANNTVVGPKVVFRVAENGDYSRLV